MQIAGSQTPLERLRGGLERVLERATTIEPPLAMLRPGPVDETSGPLLAAIRLGAARTADSVITITKAIGQLRDAGELPSGLLAASMRFTAIDDAWGRSRAYLTGLHDAGVIPGFGADMLWDGLPGLVWETRDAARSALAALDQPAASSARLRRSS